MITCLSAGAVHAQDKEIAFTFDDAPRSGGKAMSGPARTEALIAALADGGVEGAIFFSTSKHIDASGDERMRRYAAAGHYIANHSHSHNHPEADNVPAYLDDVRRAHGMLKDYDTFIPLYRYPFLNEGREIATRDALRVGLKDMGYSDGYVTVDNYDWYLEALYQRALTEGKRIDHEKLRTLYVELLLEAVQFYDAIAQETLGRSPKHVLLLHENDLAAMFVDDLALALRNAGWRIIPGPEAYDDPIARETPDTLFLGQGRVAALAEVQGRSRQSLVHEAEDEDWLDGAFWASGVIVTPDARSTGD
jgi:peptidoglycan/xylan/chitin deacetylase (PgdA/CDA1 family)